jgi:hypothetical protein
MQGRSILLLGIEGLLSPYGSSSFSVEKPPELVQNAKLILIVITSSRK